MDISKQELLDKAGIPSARFQWYRVVGLLSGPSRVDRFRGRGSRSYYSDELVDQIKRIEELRAQGKTVDQIRRILTVVEDKLSALYTGMFARGDPIDLSEPIPHSEVFRDLAHKADLAYPREFVRSYTVTSQRKGNTRKWSFQQDVIDADELELEAGKKKG